MNRIFGTSLLQTHTRAHACACTHNRFTSLLDLVWDYSGEPAPER